MLRPFSNNSQIFPKDTFTYLNIHSGSHFRETRMRGRGELTDAPTVLQDRRVATGAGPSGHREIESIERVS